MSLDKQYNSVKLRYDRRIARFLLAITDPTLFIRYISSEDVNEEGKSLELVWIEENMEYIFEVVKRYNHDNSIMFIGDESVKSDIIKVYNVPKDLDANAARSPLTKNEGLLDAFSTAIFPERQNNINRYLKKENERKKKEELGSKQTIIERICDRVKRTILKEYLHYITYDIPNR